MNLEGTVYFLVEASPSEDRQRKSKGSAIETLRCASPSIAILGGLTITTSDLLDLVGSAMVSFERVADYYFLVLDRAHVSLFNPLLEPSVPEEWAQQSVGYAVSDVELREDEYVRLSFSNGTHLIMSLRPEVYIGPEAAVFVYRERPRKWVIIQ